MKTTTDYRAIRPEARNTADLAEWVRQQPQPVIVARRQAEALRAAGAPNVIVLPFGGPQPGEIWREVPA